MNERSHNEPSSVLWKSIWKRSNDNEIINKLSENTAWLSSRNHVCIMTDFSSIIKKAWENAIEIDVILSLKCEPLGDLRTVYRNPKLLPKKIEEFLNRVQAQSEISLISSKVTQIKLLDGQNYLGFKTWGELEGVFLAYYCELSNDYTKSISNSKNAMELWNGPQYLREEMDRLTTLITALTASQKTQTEFMLMLHQAELNEAEMNAGNNTNEDLEKIDTTKLRAIHSHEVASLTEHQTQLLKYFKELRTGITKLANNLSSLEVIDKIVFCEICEHIVDIQTKNQSISSLFYEPEFKRRNISSTNSKTNRTTSLTPMPPKNTKPIWNPRSEYHYFYKDQNLMTKEEQSKSQIIYDESNPFRQTKNSSAVFHLNEGQSTRNDEGQQSKESIITNLALGRKTPPPHQRPHQPAYQSSKSRKYRNFTIQEPANQIHFSRPHVPDDSTSLERSVEHRYVNARHYFSDRNDSFQKEGQSFNLKRSSPRKAEEQKDFFDSNSKQVPDNTKFSQIDDNTHIEEEPKIHRWTTETQQTGNQKKEFNIYEDEDLLWDLQNEVKTYTSIGVTPKNEQPQEEKHLEKSLKMEDQVSQERTGILQNSKISQKVENCPEPSTSQPDSSAAKISENTENRDLKDTAEVKQNDNGMTCELSDEKSVSEGKYNSMIKDHHHDKSFSKLNESIPISKKYDEEEEARIIDKYLNPENQSIHYKAENSTINNSNVHSHAPTEKEQEDILSSVLSPLNTESMNINNKDNKTSGETNLFRRSQAKKYEPGKTQNFRNTLYGRPDAFQDKQQSLNTNPSSTKARQDNNTANFTQTSYMSFLSNNAWNYLRTKPPSKERETQAADNVNDSKDQSFTKNPIFAHLYSKRNVDAGKPFQFPEISKNKMQRDTHSPFNESFSSKPRHHDMNSTLNDDILHEVQKEFFYQQSRVPRGRFRADPQEKLTEETLLKGFRVPNSQTPQRERINPQARAKASTPTKLPNQYADTANTNIETSFFSTKRERDSKFYAQQNDLSSIFNRFSYLKNHRPHGHDQETEVNSQSFQHAKDTGQGATNNEAEKQKIEKMLQEQSRRKKERLEFTKKREEEAEKAPKDPAYYEYLEKLERHKPWLDKALIKTYSLESLRNNFPIQDDLTDLDPESKLEREKELDFIKQHVHPLFWKPRETKSDLELLYDLRYYNKHAEYLIKRVRNENYYQRLDLNPKCSHAEVKTGFKTKALFWHPDNIRKNFKFCFANENNYTKTLTEIFGLIDEAYRTLSNKERRKEYDLSLLRKF